LLVPIDPRIKTLSDTPHTVSYVIRKRQQIDSLSELGKEKMPDLETIWDKTPEDLEDWIDRVLSSKTQKNVDLIISDNDIED
jgi:hypothetical protein